VLEHDSFGQRHPRVGASGGHMLQSMKKPDSRSAGTSQDLTRDERTWVREYRRHLDRLYEPPTDLPADLDQLVKAVARRIDE
jgi:hypothetical protein